MTDYLDNNLSQIEKTAFAAHLQKCESCSEELRRQQHWLQHLSDINDSDADLSEQDRARMQEQIMMTIRSNEQASRAAGYINQYKKDVEDNLGPVEQENNPADIINKKKSVGFLSGFTRYAGYAAVLVLLIAVGILFHDRTMTGTLLDDGRAKGVSNFSTDAGVDETTGAVDYSSNKENSFDAAADDAATLPLETILETRTEVAVDVDGQESDSPSDEQFFQEESANAGKSVWGVYSGRFEDLSVVGTRDLNEESFADLFTEASGIRILTESITTTTANSTSQAGGSEDQAQTEGETIPSTVQKTETEISRVLILSAWPSEEIETANENIIDVLNNTANKDYDIIVLNERESISKIEELIGREETSAWKRQIEELDADGLLWIALLLSSDQASTE
jgi:hypothetical protein